MSPYGYGVYVGRTSQRLKEQIQKMVQNQFKTKLNLKKIYRDANVTGHYRTITFLKCPSVDYNIFNNLRDRDVVTPNQLLFLKTTNSLSPGLFNFKDIYPKNSCSFRLVPAKKYAKQCFLKAKMFIVQLLVGVF